LPSMLRGQSSEFRNGAKWRSLAFVESKVPCAASQYRGCERVCLASV
jgi:hypothetical protein